MLSAIILADGSSSRMGGVNKQFLLLCGVPVAVGGLVYAVCVVFFRGITPEDCLLLPKGEKLARFFK